MPERTVIACLIFISFFLPVKMKLHILIMRAINHRNKVTREVGNEPEFQLLLIKADAYPAVMLPLHQVSGFGAQTHG